MNDKNNATAVITTMLTLVIAAVFLYLTMRTGYVDQDYKLNKLRNDRIDVYLRAITN